MKIFRIENIILKPQFVLAHDYDDAANIFGYSLVMGLGNRPDADFDIVRLKVKRDGPARPLIEWAREGMRGMAWLVDDGAGWEMCQTTMEEP